MHQLRGDNTTNDSVSIMEIQIQADNVCIAGI
jgi:hypothetical protein